MAGAAAGERAAVAVAHQPREPIAHASSCRRCCSAVSTCRLAPLLPKAGSCLLAAGQLLSSILVFKNDGGTQADEINTAAYFYRYACMSNVAIWINGTEVVHDTPNSFTAVRLSLPGVADCLLLLYRRQPERRSPRWRR
jgi:hypothetical protein